MNGSGILLVLFVLGAAVAIGAGSAINSPLLIAAGVIVGIIGVVLYLRGRRRGLR